MTEVFAFACLALGTFLGGCALTYLMWTTVRVVFLRQDIFEIRDRLWFAAQAAGGLDDPAYIEARHHINVMATMASWFSLSVVEAMLKFAAQRVRRDGTNVALPRRSDDEVLQQAIDRAYAECTRRITNYMLYDCVSGWIYRYGLRRYEFTEVASPVGPATAVTREKWAEQRAKQYVLSGAPEDAIRYNQIIGKRRPAAVG